MKWNEDHLPGWKPGEPFNPPAEALAPYQPWARGFDWCMVGEERVYESTTGGSGPRDRRVVNKRTTTEDRILFQTSAALEFLGECGSEQPFLLCLSYYAPHVPMEAPEEFLARFPGEMPERRRYALAMMAAVDDGVGKIWSALEKNGRADNTLMFFVSDNGAPLKRTKPDAPISYRLGAWNGSLNDPLNGIDTIDFGAESLWTADADDQHNYQWTGFQIIDISEESRDFIDNFTKQLGTYG